MKNTDITGFRLRNALSMFIAMLMAACLFGLPARAMVGGTDIAMDMSDNTPGFLVTIEAYKNKGAIGYKRCLGAAITPDAVVTAGHCLSNMGYVVVKFISSKKPLEFEEIEAESWRIHPQYNGGYPEPMYSQYKIIESKQYHDIAVILLTRPYKKVEPITAVPADWVPTDERGDPPPFYVFGQARNDAYVPVHGLQLTTLDNIKSIAATKHWMTAVTAPDTVICVADSGSPVTLQSMDETVSGRPVHFLLGIQTSVDGEAIAPKNLDDAFAYFKMAGNFPNCTRNFSFVSVAEHNDWITHALAELDPANPRSVTYWGESHAMWMRGKDLNARPVVKRAAGEKVFPSCMLGPRLVYTNLDGKCLDFKALQDGDEFMFKGKSLTYDANHFGTFADWIKEQTAQ
jgi:hypothetical protein